MNNIEIKFSFSVSAKLYILFVLSGGNFDIRDDYYPTQLRVLRRTFGFNSLSSC